MEKHLKEFTLHIEMEKLRDLIVDMPTMAQVSYEGRLYEVDESNLIPTTEQKRRDEVEVAFKEGVAIQYKNEWTPDWMDKESGRDLMWDKSNYRIKPQPQYQPFTTEDYKEYLGKIALPKKEFADKKTPFMVTGPFNLYYNLIRLFDYYTFEDGTPFGKKI